MDEIRTNNKVKIESTKGGVIDGVVLAVEYDRVAIRINPQNLDTASKIKELDELKVCASTHFGEKTMISAVISELNQKNIIIIENSPALSHAQNRKHVRVQTNFDFLIKFNFKIFRAKALNISAGGIAFCAENADFKLDDELIMNFSADIFESDFECEAKIIKINDDNYIAGFNNINENNESKIIKYVFKNVSKSSMGI